MHKIFISHSWSKSDLYEEFTELLNSNRNKYYDLSVPFAKPIIGGNKYVISQIKKSIQLSNTVIFLADYRYYASRWIQLEHRFAENMNKNIIVIKSKDVIKLPASFNNREHPTFLYNRRTIASQIDSLITSAL